MLLAKKKNSRLHVTSTFACLFTLLIVRQASGKTFPNMSGTGGAADPRVKAAVRMMKVHATLSLPQAMWMAKFSESECKNRTMQMRVRRAHLAQMPIVGTDIGTKWMATGGSHLMTEDFFKSVEIPRRENEIKAMEMNKSQRIKGEKLRQDAELILMARRDALANKQYNLLNATELETLLKWHNVPKAHKEKKPAMIGRWATIWEGGLKPPFFEVWTDVDEEKLEELKAMDIDMSQTALGRLKELKKREAFISVREMNEEEREKMRRSLDEIEAEAALGNIVDSLTEDGAEEGAEHSVNVGEMDAV